MYAPTFIFKSSVIHAGTGAISVTRPTAGVGAIGDLELLFVESANQAVSTPSGFSVLPNTPVGVGTAASTTATRLSVFYRFNNGETTSISIADSGDHTLACLFVLRGVDQDQPFSDVFTYSNATAGTSFSQSGLNLTTDIGSYLFAVVADQIDSTTSQGVSPGFTFTPGIALSWTTASHRTASGNGGGLTLRYAQIEDPSGTAITDISITSTGSIIPCAAYFFVRGFAPITAEAIIDATESVSVSILAEPSVVKRSAAISATSSLFIDYEQEGADILAFVSALIPMEESIVCQKEAVINNIGLENYPSLVYMSPSAISSTGAISITRPALFTKPGDLELLIVETANQAVATPSGFLEHPLSPLGAGTAAATNAVRLSIFYRFNNGETASIAVADPGDHIVAALYCLRNVDRDNPFKNILGGTVLDVPAENSVGLVADCSSYPGPYCIQAVNPLPSLRIRPSLMVSVVADSLDSTAETHYGPYLGYESSAIGIGQRVYRSTSGNGGGFSVQGISKSNTNDEFLSQDREVYTSSYTVSLAVCVFEINGDAGFFTPPVEILEREKVLAHIQTTESTSADLEITSAMSTAFVTSSSSYSSLSVPRVAGLSTGDLELLFIEYDTEYSFPLEVKPPFGWRHAPGSPFSRFSMLWRIANGDTDNISVSFNSTSHIAAAHAYVKNVVVEDDFFIYAGKLTNFTDASANDVRVWPDNIVKPFAPGPGAKFAVFSVSANDGDSTSTTHLVNTDIGGAIDVWYEETSNISTQVEILNQKLQTNVGDGGGISVCAKRAEVLDTHPDDKIYFRYSQVEYDVFWPNRTGFISLGLKSKYGPHVAAKDISFQHTSSCSATISTVGSRPESCPYIYARTITVGQQEPYPCPVYKEDGSTVGSLSSLIGMLDLLMVYTMDSTQVPSGDGWTKIHRVIQGNDCLIVFWRWHTEHTLVPVTLPETFVGCRMAIAGAFRDNPIPAIATGYSAAAKYVPIVALEEGNGYDPINYPHYGKFIFPTEMSMVLGFSAHTYSYPPAYVSNAGPQTSLNTWEVKHFNLPGQGSQNYNFSPFVGKRYFASTNPAALAPSKLGRCDLPDMHPNWHLAWRIVGMWLMIVSEDVPVNAMVPASITHTSTIMVAAVKTLEAVIVETAAVDSVVAKGSERSSTQDSASRISAAVFSGRQLSSSVLFGHEIFAYAIPAESNDNPERFGTAVFSTESSLFSLFEKGATSSIAEVLFSTLLSESLGLETLLGRAEILHVSAAVVSSEKGGSSEVSLTGSSLLLALSEKSSFREFLLSLAATSSVFCRVVTTFEYGDIVVIDLRAVPAEMEQSCLRVSPVIEVRRGEDLEFSAVRAEFEAPGRRRHGDIVGEQVRLLGKEIVCVREVFDESK